MKKIEDGLTRDQRYRLNNPEKVKQSQKEYRERNKQRLKEKRQSNRQQHNQTARVLYEHNRSIIIEQMGGHCVNCGTTENLEFDHIYPQLKHEKLSHLLKKSMTRIQQEAEKCQLLCKSCHKHKTIKQRQKSWELFCHLTPDQMDDIMSGNRQINELTIN